MYSAEESLGSEDQARRRAMIWVESRCSTCLSPLIHQVITENPLELKLL